MTILERLLDAGITAVLPAPLPLPDLTMIIDALLATPIPAVDVSLADPQALDVVRALSQRGRENVLVGVRGVREIADVEAVALAGAKFVISHNLDHALQVECTKHGLVYIPSVISLFAARSALQTGCAIVRLVTHGAAGADYLRTIKQTLPDEIARIAVAGDISPELVTTYKEAGATFLMIEEGIVSSGEQKMGEIILNGRRLLHAWNPELVANLDDWRNDG